MKKHPTNVCRLKCTACSEKSAFVITKKKLVKVTGSPLDNSLACKAGFLPPSVISSLINLVKEIFTRTFTWFEKK